MPLYHKSVYWPEWISRLIPRSVFVGHTTSHALIEAQRDRYGRFDFPARLDLTQGDIIEIETIQIGNRVKLSKILVKNAS